MEYPKYLVRPHDFSIYDLDETNNCYRYWSRNPPKYSDGTRPNAMEHFTYDNLTQNYDFFPIKETQLEMYEQKHNDYYDFVSWQSRPDGHGGSKGGSYEEYLMYKERCIKYKESHGHQ